MRTSVSLVLWVEGLSNLLCLLEELCSAEELNKLKWMKALGFRTSSFSIFKWTDNKSTNKLSWGGLICPTQLIIEEPQDM